MLSVWKHYVKVNNVYRDKLRFEEAFIIFLAVFIFAKFTELFKVSAITQCAFSFLPVHLNSFCSV